MLHDPRVRVVSFTGSTEVGRKLLHSAADQVLNTAMELGGNAPFIVFEDADIDAAIDGAMIAKMRNMGEACTAANRFYVHEKVQDEFSKKLTAKMAALKMGNGLDDGVALGPLVNEEGRDKVIELVDDAVSKGAKILTGGKTPDGTGYFYPATVLSNVPDNAKMLNEEIFGPVASLQTFKDEAEVIKRANDTEYGLVAYLYTKDLGRGMRVSEKLDFGMIGLNRGLVSDPAAPFGGMKQSGIGREGAHEGLMEFLETQYIVGELVTRKFAMDVLMPQLGETVAEGKITKWFKAGRRRREAGRQPVRDRDRQGVDGGAVDHRRHARRDQACRPAKSAPVGAVVAVIARRCGRELRRPQSPRRQHRSRRRQSSVRPRESGSPEPRTGSPLSRGRTRTRIAASFAYADGPVPRGPHPGAQFRSGEDGGRHLR